MLARSLLAVVFLVQVTCLQASGTYSWTAGICSSCSSVADLHNDCCDGGAVCDDCCGCETSWSISADFLWMGRTRSRQQPLIITDIAGLQLTSLDAQDLSFDTDGGVRMRIGRKLESGREFEILYFGIYDQAGRQAINVDPATPMLNSVTYRFFGNAGGTATAYSAEYQSDLHSAEVNMRLLPRYGLTPIAGLRWLKLEEQLEITETAAPTTGAFATASNDLVGVQVGVHADLWNRADRMRLEAAFKLGLFGNDVGLRADERTAGVPFSALNREFSQASMVAEYRITFVYQPCPYLAFRVGFTGLWMDDVAIVGNQLNSFNIGTGAGTLQTSTVSFNGGHLGIELRW